MLPHFEISGRNAENGNKLGSLSTHDSRAYIHYSQCDLYRIWPYSKHSCVTTATERGWNPITFVKDQSGWCSENTSPAYLDKPVIIILFGGYLMADCRRRTFQEETPFFHPHTHMTPSDTIYQSLRNVINLLAHIFQQLLTSPRLTFISTTEVLVGSFLNHACYVTARRHDRHC